jgi:argininosuccinate synthase
MSGGEIDRWEAPGDGDAGWCAPRAEWPAEPLRVTLRFERGEAVSLDGEALAGPELLRRLNAVFGAYGVGRGIYTGDTTIGLKGRIVFEAPGMTALLTAHQALEEAVLTASRTASSRGRAQVGRARLRGLLPRPAQDDLEAFLSSSQPWSTGAVTLETRGGPGRRGRGAPRRTSSAKGATYAQSADWGVEEAEGFIRLYGMSSTLWAEVNRGR